jgi:hypothetical protein
MHAVVLRHAIHFLMPTFEGLGRDFSKWLQPPPRLAETLETWILSMTNGIIEIKLGSKVPPAVICVLAPDVVRVKSQECLVGGHAQRTAVK